MPDRHRAALVVLLTACTSAVLSSRALAGPGETVWEYPARMLDTHDGRDDCWRGMDADGNWLGPDSRIRTPVVPRDWLVGPPPSDLSAVTIPEDHWVNLAFSGRIVDAEGPDILVLESGMMGEQALVFLTDGADQEYVVDLAEAQWTGQPDISRIEIDLAGKPAPFVARGIRILGTDFGGGSPGFDLASVRARVSHECGLKVRSPNPPSGAAGVEPDVRLNWTPTCTAGRQRVYCSPVESQVIAAATDALQATLPADANSFRPQVELAGTYYWRVDTSSPTDANLFYTGDVWSFTVADHVIVDGFETYADDTVLQDSWWCSRQSSVSLGAVGSQTCDLSMHLGYSYDGSTWPYAIRWFDHAQDWTRNGARVLQVRLGGDLPNPINGDVYVGLTDGVHGQIVLYSSADAAGNAGWRLWRISLGDFNGVDLAQVRALVIGVRPRSIEMDEPETGVLRIADICLYPTMCLKERPLAADLNGDCGVDYRDVERMAADWLRTRVRSYRVAEPNHPVLWYTFDGHANDSAGSAHGRLLGRTVFGPGVYGQAVRFSYEGDAVTIPDAERVFAGIREAITIAFWQYGDDTPHLNDTICCSNYEYGKSNPAISVNLGCWQNPGQYRWDCGYPWSFADRLAGRHHDKKEWTGRWNHWVFTKDIRPTADGAKGRMAIYLNGELYDSRTGTDSPITNITSFEIGSGWYGRYDGLIDEFRIYDYALSPAEVAWVATNSTGTFEDPVPSPADLDASGRVDFRDFALLATRWLEDTTWP